MAEQVIKTISLRNNKNIPITYNIGADAGNVSCTGASNLQDKLDNIDESLNGTLKTASAGAANGVATLDESGKVPAAQLPNIGITTDTEMSDTSTNAVQNKVIKQYIDNKHHIEIISRTPNMRNIMGPFVEVYQYLANNFTKNIMMDVKMNSNISSLEPYSNMKLSIFHCNDNNGYYYAICAGQSISESGNNINIYYPYFKIDNAVGAQVSQASITFQATNKDGTAMSPYTVLATDSDNIDITITIYCS